MIHENFTGSTQNSNEVGTIGRIPVRNLWLLMLYASECYREIGNDSIDVEENPDDIPELVAKILCHQVERRIRKNLSSGYASKEQVMDRVRGSIDLLKTERFQLLNRGKIACRFEELTIDTTRNRFVRDALETISNLVKRSDLAHRCRLLANLLRRMGVSGTRPSKSEISSERFGRHDCEDRPMVFAAKLAFNLALPTENPGERYLTKPDREVRWVRDLFEKGIAGFYKVTLSHKGWVVSGGTQLNWPFEERSSGIEKIFPSMKTDIILDHVETSRRFVIDTKFNSILKSSNWYRAETLRSSYIYQIYAYLRSQEGKEGEFTDKAIGMLLHPSVDNRLFEKVKIQQHEIRFATVDLGDTAKSIRRQLLQILE